jgi:hypothetical protein
MADYGFITTNLLSSSTSTFQVTFSSAQSGVIFISSSPISAGASGSFTFPSGATYYYFSDQSTVCIDVDLSQYYVGVIVYDVSPPVDLSIAVDGQTLSVSSIPYSGSCGYALGISMNDGLEVYALTCCGFENPSVGSTTIVLGNANKNEVKIKNVKYYLDDNLIITNAEIDGDNAFALTTEGFVPWKKTITLTEIVENQSYVFPSKIQRAKIFCIDYICLGDIPPEDSRKINKDQVIVYSKLRKREKAIVEEKNNELIITIPSIDHHGLYFIGFNTSEGTKFIDSFQIDKNKLQQLLQKETLKIVYSIPKGTCVWTAIEAYCYDD